MPMIAGAMAAMGFASSELSRWRPAMMVPAALMLLTAWLYWRYTTDCPKGNYEDMPTERPQRRAGESGLFMSAVKDHRVWLLFLIYGGCFGMELFVNGRAATYYQERFEMSEGTAGLIASLFGLMNIFARSLGGWLGDRFAATGGLTGPRARLGAGDGDGGRGAGALLAHGDHRLRDRHDGGLLALRADGRGRHLLGGAVHQQTLARRGVRHRRRRWQRGRRGLCAAGARAGAREVAA